MGRGPAVGESSAPEQTAQKARLPWTTTTAWLLGLLLAAAVAVAAIAAVPPILRNLSSAPADGVTATALPGVADASLVAPEGWVLQRDGDRALIVSSPDRVLSVSFAAVSGDAEEALQALLLEAGASPAGETKLETLRGGLPILHTDGADGAVYAVVGAGAQRIAVIARVADDAESGIHRAALAELLDGLRP